MSVIPPLLSKIVFAFLPNPVGNYKTGNQMYLLRLKKKVKGSPEIKTNAFQYCYTDETFQQKKGTRRLSSNVIPSQEELSGPDAASRGSDMRLERLFSKQKSLERVVVCVEHFCPKMFSMFIM